MFAKLTGKIDSVFQDSLILDVNGVGYHIFASARTLGIIGNAGDGASLLIETHVREDHIHLYGFASQAEREWFKILTGVQGVGAKSGLAILSSCPPDKLILAIASNDTSLLRQADGVGPKLATRIITELKDKVQNMNLAPSVSKSKNEKIKTETESQIVDFVVDQDAVSALVNLGYARADAFSAVMSVRQKSNDNNSLEILIKLALKELSA